VPHRALSRGVTGAACAGQDARIDLCTWAHQMHMMRSLSMLTARPAPVHRCARCSCAARHTRRLAAGCSCCAAEQPGRCCSKRCVLCSSPCICSAAAVTWLLHCTPIAELSLEGPPAHLTPIIHCITFKLAFTPRFCTPVHLLCRPYHMCPSTAHPPEGFGYA
jgi:hypothetical protein